MAMLDGLRDVFKQALRFCHNEISYNFLVKRWNEECEEVYKYKQALIAEERARHKPTADVVEVRHGKWEDRPNPQWKAYDIRHCSKCGWNIPKNNLRKKDLNWNYCPHCGARMDGDSNDL